MKISVADGSVEFAGNSVMRTTSKAFFLASPLGQGARAIVENGPYVTYQIFPETGIGVTLSFHGQKLESLAWALEMPAEDKSSWSVESEIRRKKFHDEWLLEQLGEPPYQFEWGEIVSEYDAKGMSSAIMMAYGN